MTFLVMVFKLKIQNYNCFNGTKTENLSEFAGRLCYKSGYKGKKNRNSNEYHKHIIEVNHHSIYGHNTVTFILANDTIAREWAFAFAAQPVKYSSI